MGSTPIKSIGISYHLSLLLRLLEKSALVMLWLIFSLLETEIFMKKFKLFLLGTVLLISLSTCAFNHTDYAFSRWYSGWSV